MAGWLQRAAESFSKKEPPAPEPFDVGCDCGGRVTGFRVPAAQKPSCPLCGQSVFVLPGNVYPIPVKSVPKKTKSSAKPSKKETRSNEATPAEEMTSGGSRSLKSGKSAATKPGKPDETTRQPPPDGIAIETRIRIFTPLRIIALVMMLIGGATIWGLWGRYQVESAKAIVAKSIELGTAAMKQQDYPTAALELEKARRAVDVLKRTDAEAELVRRMSREAIAAKGLAGSSLVDLVRESLADVKSVQAKPDQKSSDRAWESAKFEGLHRNAWVLFDASVIASDSPQEACIVELPVFHQGKQVRIQVVSKVIWSAAHNAMQKSQPASRDVSVPGSIEDLTSQTNRVPRVIFAAQLESIAPAAGALPDAVLKLKGETAFLWTSYDSYRALGYLESDEQEVKVTEDLLERQKAIPLQ